MTAPLWHRLTEEQRQQTVLTLSGLIRRQLHRPLDTPPVGVHAGGVVGVRENDAPLVDRSASPWDAEPRRPSHLDRRKALLAETLRAEFQAAKWGCGQRQKMRDLVEHLMLLAA